MGASGEKINPDLIEGLFSFTSILNYVVLNLNSKVTLVIQTPVHLNVYKLKDILQEVDKNVNKATEHGYIIESILYTTDSITPVNAVKVSRTIFNKMLENQKIVLHELSELKENTNAKENNINNDVTITIKNIFAEVLDKDVSVINNNDHFFLDLGGTSLDYCTCLVRIQNEYDLNIDMSDKRCMTINDFSQYILDRKGGKYE
ncbi:MAG: acyl carrier protein [Mycoplasmoidaceae bacterium]|nr:acyl carrier protein [Mycoplasmoidaceae bacterium]